MFIPDNDYICDCIHRDQGRAEALHEDCQAEINTLEEEIHDIRTMVKSDLDSAIEELNDYDIEDNADLGNRLEKVRGILVALYDKMEG